MIPITFVIDYTIDEETQLYNIHHIITPEKGEISFSQNLCFQIETPGWMRGFFAPSFGFDDEVLRVSFLADVLLNTLFSIDGEYIYINLQNTLQFGDLNIFDYLIAQIDLTPNEFEQKKLSVPTNINSTLDPWIEFTPEIMTEIKRMENLQKILNS